MVVPWERQIRKQGSGPVGTAVGGTHTLGEQTLVCVGFAAEGSGEELDKKENPRTQQALRAVGDCQFSHRKQKAVKKTGC